MEDKKEKKISIFNIIFIILWVSLLCGIIARYFTIDSSAADIGEFTNITYNKPDSTRLQGGKLLRLVYPDNDVVNNNLFHGLPLNTGDWAPDSLDFVNNIINHWDSIKYYKVSNEQYISMYYKPDGGLLTILSLSSDTPLIMSHDGYYPYIYSKSSIDYNYTTYNESYGIVEFNTGRIQKQSNEIYCNFYYIPNGFGAFPIYSNIPYIATQPNSLTGDLDITTIEKLYEAYITYGFNNYIVNQIVDYVAKTPEEIQQEIIDSQKNLYFDSFQTKFVGTSFNSLDLNLYIQPNEYMLNNSSKFSIRLSIVNNTETSNIGPIGELLNGIYEFPYLPNTIETKSAYFDIPISTVISSRPFNNNTYVYKIPYNEICDLLGVPVLEMPDSCIIPSNGLFKLDTRQTSIINYGFTISYQIVNTDGYRSKSATYYYNFADGSENDDDQLIVGPDSVPDIDDPILPNSPNYYPSVPDSGSNGSVINNNNQDTNSNTNNIILVDKDYLGENNEVIFYDGLNDSESKDLISKLKRYFNPLTDNQFLNFMNMSLGFLPDDLRALLFSCVGICTILAVFQFIRRR